MSDGPFANLKLLPCWKAFQSAIDNDANEVSECTGLAVAALLESLKWKQLAPLIEQLRSLLTTNNLLESPEKSITKIFEDHPKSPFGEILERELLYAVSNGQTPSQAFESGLHKSVVCWIGRELDHILDQWRLKHGTGSITEVEYVRRRDRVKKSFEEVDAQQQICCRLGNSSRCNVRSVRKRTGIDDGPAL